MKNILPEDDKDNSELIPLKKTRNNKNSEVLNDSDRLGLLKNNQGGSNSSLHFSS